MADTATPEFEAGYYDHSPYSVISELPEYTDDYDYDPAAYGPQTLLMFDSGESVRPMVFDVEYDYKGSGDSGYDHSSPSSNGDHDNRSRGSSVSSHGYVPQGSPNMDAAFAQLHFSPPEKPMSPPALVIPESEPSAENGGPRLHIVPATPLSPAEVNISAFRSNSGDFASNQRD